MRAEMAVDSLLEVIERSGVIAGDQMQDLLKELRQRRSKLDSSKNIAAELVSRGMLTRWQAEQLLHGKHRGFFLGPYRILDLLGTGGMGRVYLAEHQIMLRRCAIKVLPPKESKRESGSVDRFYREAQAVAALDHPNIVRAYDVNKARVGTTEIHYLVMEYVDGQDLQRMVEGRGGLDYRQAADFIRQAAEGLAHAHERGLIHRDIKPANLIVDAHGVVKILDLGLACCLDDETETAIAARKGEGVAGTADYLAPEQAVDSRNIDARADIYSLGHTFYFLLAGHPPFPVGTVPERLLAHQTKAPEPITNTRPDAPPGLLAIIDKMTAKKPVDRFLSAKQVVEALDKWLGDRPTDRGPRATLSRLGDRGFPSPASFGVATDVVGSAMEDTELELAPLEDDKPAARKTKAAVVGKEAQPISPGGDAQPVSDSGQHPARPSLTEGEHAKAEAEGHAPLRLADLAPSQKDLVALLDEGDLIPGLMASQSAPTLLVTPKAKKRPRESLLARLLDSPIFWLSIAGVVILVLIVGVVLNLPSTEQPSQQGPARGAPQETTGTESPPPPPPPGTQAAEKEPGQAAPAQATKAGPANQAVAPPAGKGSPPTPSVGAPKPQVIVPAGSTWKYLNPTDGIDPVAKEKNFDYAFSTLDYDDSHWLEGQDSVGPAGGFGYGDSVGVALDRPRRENRKTAYFRHKFKTNVAYEKLSISLQRDDGVIVYLDGREVGRNNVGTDKDAFDLYAWETIDGPGETEVISFKLAGTLPPGEHVLAISLHNRPGGSSDLRIAEISLHGTPVPSPAR